MARRGFITLCASAASTQGLTLLHLSAQLEPCLARLHTLHTLNTPWHPLTPPKHGLHNPYAHPLSHKSRLS
jgi:hypothetical protein